MYRYPLGSTFLFLFTKVQIRELGFSILLDDIILISHTKDHCFINIVAE